MKFVIGVVIVFLFNVLCALNLYMALTTGKITGRRGQIYDVNTQPGLFWFTFWWPYLIGLICFAALAIIWLHRASHSRKASAREIRSVSGDAVHAFDPPQSDAEAKT